MDRIVKNEQETTRISIEDVHTLALNQKKIALNAQTQDVHPHVLARSGILRKVYDRSSNIVVSDPFTERPIRRQV